MQAIRPIYIAPKSRPVSSIKLQYTLWYLVIVATIFASFLLIPCQIGFTTDDYITIASFAAIGLYCLAALYFTCYQHPFSMNCSHWVFVLFFLAYAPLIQFLTQNFPGQADIGVFEPFHLEVNALILAWCVCYSLTYKFVFALKPKLRRPAPGTSDEQKPNYPWLTLFCLACTALAIGLIGLSNLLSRGALGQEANQSANTFNSPLLLIMQTVGRVCPLAVLVVLLVTGRRRQISYYICLACAVACALVTNFPPAIARFAAGGVIIGLICLALRYRRMTSLWLLLTFWLGFVIAMPFLNLFRHDAVQDAGVSSYQQQDIASVVTGGDFDAYMMVIATVSYGQRPGNITMGRQLVGNLLFFVPRFLWPDKPEASSVLVVQNTVLNFYNLSEPLPAEGFVNFGVVGVLVFAIGFGWIVAALDKSYWANLEQSRRARPTVLMLMYPFLVGSVIILMRGALLTSFAYTLGPVAAYWLALRVAYIGTKPQPMPRKNAAPRQIFPGETRVLPALKISAAAENLNSNE